MCMEQSTGCAPLMGEIILLIGSLLATVSTVVRCKAAYSLAPSLPQPSQHLSLCSTPSPSREAAIACCACRARCGYLAAPYDVRKLHVHSAARLQRCWPCGRGSAIPPLPVHARLLVASLTGSCARRASRSGIGRASDAHAPMTAFAASMYMDARPPGGQLQQRTAQTP